MSPWHQGQTVLLPTGISFIFGAMSSRRSDLGIQRMSGLNTFLEWIQRGIFVVVGGAYCMYGVFGDSTFSINLHCIQSYCKAFGLGEQLTDKEKRCNHTMEAARITIEKLRCSEHSFFVFVSQKRGSKLPIRTHMFLSSC